MTNLAAVLSFKHVTQLCTRHFLNFKLKKLKLILQKLKKLIDRLIDFNGMSTSLGLFYA